MVIEKQEDVSRAVLEEMRRTPDAGEQPRACLPGRRAALRERRIDRALADARSGAPFPRLGARPGWQGDRRRRSRRLAFLAGRAVREPGCDAGADEPARQVHHRRARRLQLPQRQARGLPGADRRADRRAVACPGAAQLPPGAPPLPHPQAGLQDDRLAGLRPGRSASRNRQPVRRHPGPDRRLPEERRRIFARIHVHPRGGRELAAQGADHRESRGVMPRVIRETLVSVRDLVLTWGPFLLIGLALLVAAYLLLDPDPPRRVVLATGPEQSAYAAFGKRYQAELQRYGIQVELRPTLASRDNLRLLRHEKQHVDLAFVQGGSSEATRLVDEDKSGVPLASLRSLFYEPVWSFYP